MVTQIFCSSIITNSAIVYLFIYIVAGQELKIVYSLDNETYMNRNIIGIISFFSEKRLTPVIAPVRKRREARGSGWDDTDDSVGFPSLEGALMAISFLTFAVYLVQLVMVMLISAALLVRLDNGSRHQ